MDTLKNREIFEIPNPFLERKGIEYIKKTGKCEGTGRSTLRGRVGPRELKHQDRLYKVDLCTGDLCRNKLYNKWRKRRRD